MLSSFWARRLLASKRLLHDLDDGSHVDPAEGIQLTSSGGLLSAQIRP